MHYRLEKTLYGFTYQNDDYFSIIKSIILIKTQEEYCIITTIDDGFGDSAIAAVPERIVVQTQCFRSKSVEEIKNLITSYQNACPLPLDFFEMLNGMRINFPEYVFDPVKTAKEKTLEDALTESLKVFEAGSSEKIMELAHYYQTNNQINEYIHVLEAIPYEHPSFIEANQQLLSVYNTLNEKVTLSKKFKAAYNGRLADESALYFSELASEKEIGRLFPMRFGGNADFIIDIAQLLSKKNQDIEKLTSPSDKATSIRFF